MGEISRRTFLKGSAALAGTTLLASLGLNASAEVAQSDEEKVVSAKTGTSPVSAQRDSGLNQPINSGKEIDNIHNQLKVWQPRPQLRADSDRQSAREDQCDHCGNQGGCK